MICVVVSDCRCQFLKSCLSKARRTVELIRHALGHFRLFACDDPPPLKWSAVMVKKMEEPHGEQATEAGRDCLEVAAG